MAHVQTRLTTVDNMLMELIALAGQAAHVPPVLELLFDDILTRTWTVKAAGTTWLMVSAILPKFYSIYPLFIRASVPADFNSVEAGLAKTEMLWMPESGRYIALAKLPAAVLPDQKALMDAILDTSDEADHFRQTRCGQAYIL